MNIILPDGGKSLGDTIKQATFVHHQDIASATWTINHPLGRKCSVTLVDSSLRVFGANVQYTSDYQIVVTLAAATTGKVYLN